MPKAGHHDQCTAGPLIISAVITCVLALCVPVNILSQESTTDPELVSTQLEEVRTLLSEGQVDTADEQCRQLLRRITTEYGGQSLEVAEVLDIQIMILIRQGQGRQPQTLNLAERVVTIREDALGPDHIQVARSLYTQGRLLRNSGEYAKARPLLERSLAVYEKNLGPEHSDVARTHNSLGALLWKSGDYEAAKTHILQGLVIREKIYGPEHLEVAKSLDNLAVVYALQADYANARSTIERVLAIKEKNLGPDHPQVAITLNNLANILGDIGDYDAAIAAHERALVIKEKNYGPDDPEVAVTLTNLGTLYVEQGDFTKAQTTNERALIILEESVGKQHPEVARILNNQATLDQQIGDYDQARLLYERSLGIREAILPNDHPDLAQSYNNLGALLVEMGDFQRAEQLCRQALAIREASLGQDHYLLGSPLVNLGQIYLNTGELERARSHLERGEVLIAEGLGADHPYTGEALAILAEVLERQGDLEAARKKSERSLVILETSLGANHPGVAMSLVQLATVHMRLGHVDTALVLTEQAAAIFTQTYGADHPLLARCLANQAQLFWVKGDARQAFTTAMQAEAMSREHLLLTSRSLPERQALRYASTRTRGLDLVLTILVEESQPLAEDLQVGLEALIHARALVLDQIAARNRTVAEASQIAQLAGNLGAAQQRLANLLVRGPQQESSWQHGQLLQKARLEKEEAERALAQKSASFGEQRHREQAGLAEVAAALPARSALVSYTQFDIITPSSITQTPGSVAVGGSSPLSRAYLAFVLRQDDPIPVCTFIGTAGEVDSLITAWKMAVTGPQNPGAWKSYAEAEIAYLEASGALYERIWEPLAPQLRDLQTIFIVPDGGLNLVSFSALPGEDSRYLAESGPLLHYLSAERDLVIPPDEQVHGQGFLAMGNPSFDNTEANMFAAPQAEEKPTSRNESVPLVLRGSQSQSTNFQSLSFKPLPYTADEIDALALLWSEYSASDHAEAEVIVLQGDQATETGFKIMSPGRRVIHLASHGFFLGGSYLSPPPSHGDGNSTERTVYLNSPTWELENPLLLSGLALAGANERLVANPNIDDGILTAEEISSLDLSGVEWAVLSACATGIGKIEAGEGVFGLRRAFQVAGAQTLIMSLWPVADEATRNWMAALYEARLYQNLNTAEAIRSANLEILNERREYGLSTHPFFWAAFVAAGRWD